MEINVYVQQFSRIIQRIFDEKYELSRYHAERLLTHLKNDKCHPAKILLSMPMFSDLIFHSIENLHAVSTQNKIFIIEVLTVLFKNELQFNRLQNQGLQLCLIKKYMKMNIDSKYPSAELHYAFVKLAIAQLSHTSGLRMIVVCKIWEYVMYPDMHHRPAYVARTAYEFMSLLVWQLDEFEEEATLNEILGFIVHPLNISAYQTLTIFDPENEKLISDPIITPLNILLTILSETSRLIKCKYFLPLLKVMFLVGCPLYKVLSGSRDQTVVGLVNDITFRLHFAISARAIAKDGRTESVFLNELVASFLNQLTTLLLEKRMVPAIMDFATKANMFWSKVGSTLFSSSFERNGQEYLIEDQFITVAIVPLLTYTATSYKHADHMMERYNVKIAKTVTEHVIKHSYIYKMIMETGDLKKIVIQGVKELFKLKGLLKAPQAGMVFQSLYYVLEMYIITDDPDRIFEENPLKTSDDVKLLSLVLDCMKMLLVEHNIHWYENVEIISLQNGLLNLMKQISLPSKQLQQVLELIDLSVRKFLSPDMTLLVESKRGSTLDEIAAVMKSYIQHEEWEVRDSALSLLLSCTDVAFVKYVPLQKLICENGLVLLASHAALSDSEYYVQSAALKCLAAATKVECIWRDVMKANTNLYKQLIYLLRNNPEGLIRKEVVNVLTHIYIHQKTSPLFEKCMYNIMATAALDDLHWEVQLEALYFWKPVIKKHLNNKGMIDGKFPKVTFSKEKRKIIVLDENEVKKQLASILNDLSDIGCLRVLHDCLSEEFNTEVMSRANCMSKKLVEVLDRHGFDKCPEIGYGTIDEPMEETVKEEIDEDMVLDLSFVLDTEARRDQIIDEIVNTKQKDLIMNLNEKHVNVNGVLENDVPLPLCPPKKQKISPNKFLEMFRYTDYDNLIEIKRNWNVANQTLDALLDEILAT